MPDLEIDQKYLDTLEQKYPNKKTRDNYVSRLRALVSHLDTGIQEILNNPDEYYPKQKRSDGFAGSASRGF